MERLRFLLLEDNPTDAELVIHELQRAGFGGESVRAVTREAFEAGLDPCPDAILSDYQLPSWDGLQALRLVRERGLDVPFIIVSGAIGEDIAVEAMRHGADDYLLKDRLSRLGPALTRALGRKRLRDEAGKAAEALRESMAGLDRAQVMAGLAHVITGPDGSFESWSATLPALIGAQSAQMPKSTRAWLDILHPDDREKFRDKAIEAGVAHARRDVEYRMRRADGAWIHVRQVMEPLGGQTVATERGRWFNTLQDVTDQKQADERIRRLNRVYAVLSGINTLIVRVRDRDELFREACRIAVQSGQFPLAFVAVVDPRDQLLKAVAWAGDERGFVHLTRPTVDAKGQGKPGLGAQAIQQRIPVVCNDIEADGSAMRYAKEALERGYRSAAALPLVVDGTGIGALVLFAAEAGFFDAEEMKLLTELAGDIAFALEHIEKEEKVGRLTRTYAVLSGINALIVRVRDREELFRGACRIAVEAGLFRMSWIGMVDRKAMKIVPIASAGAKPEYMAFIKDHFSLAAESPMGNTLAAQAIREKKAVFSNDTQNDPRVQFIKEHVERGTRSIAVLPLLVADEAVGALVLYTEEADFFDAAEMSLLTELASDISFALDHLEKAERLDYLAYYDSLTGLANRSLFLERLAPYMRSAASGGHKLALFLIDLERFKNINDSLGRPAGDALLRQVAEWLTRNVGDASLVARVGPDDFGVVLPEVKPEGNVARLLEKAMEAFLEHPFRLNDAVFHIAIKVGAALYPDDGADADTLFKNAEAAVKKAKASGDRYLFYAQQMTEMVAGRLTLENQLRQALEKEEFVLHYQPKVDSTTGAILGVEALIRWNSAELGLVPPMKFIPLMEETGLILEVGAWALQKAVQVHSQWLKQGLLAPRIAVNVSPIQLRKQDFVSTVERTLTQGAMPPGIDLEITESLVMEDIQGNIAKLKQIRDLGVGIAIDDFGTGYSSLAYLAKLPVQSLKIDRSFIITMLEDSDTMLLVSTIISLAHSLRLRVVAEGVDAEAQAEFLRPLGCDEMQGYLFSRPLPIEEITALLGKAN